MVDAYYAVTATSATSVTPSAPVAGIPGFTGGAATQVQIHAAILASDEFFNNNGGTATGFITGLYEKLLNRAPDPAGLQQWVGTYNSDTVSRYQIALAIASAPEARLVEVATWYQQDLGRTSSIAQLESDPGVNAWAQLLLQGVGDNTVQAAILSSPEFLAEHGGTPASEVLGFYETLLDRNSDPAGEAYWAGLLQEGLTADDVVRMFQASAEVAQTLVATWFAQDLGRTASIALLKQDPGVDGFAGVLGNF